MQMESDRCQRDGALSLTLYELCLVKAYAHTKTLI
jgi:hypothetical protein